MKRLDEDNCLRRIPLKVRFGTTLMEALVVLAIISLLLSLVLPGIQGVRESARRTGCAEKLGQLAVASHSFESVHGTLPPTAYVRMSNPTATVNHPGVISALAQLLPFLEQRALHDQVDYSETAFSAYPDPGSRVNSALLSRDVDMFQCPSDALAAGATSYRVSQGAAPAFAGATRLRRGAFFTVFGSRPGGQSRWPRLSHITDGMAYTALMSERILGDADPAVFFPPGDARQVSGADFTDPDDVARACSSWNGVPIQDHLSTGGRTWLLNGYAYTWYNHVLTPNSITPDCTDSSYFAQGAATARSWHPGGVNLASADCSIHFVSEELDLHLWRALGTRSGHEPLGNW